MEFLAPVNDQVFMINSTTGQILGNSKLYTLNFPEIIPETHVSRDPVRLKKIIDDFGGAMVVKPLQRFGGEGVIKVSIRDQENLNSLINYYVKGYKNYPERESRSWFRNFWRSSKKKGMYGFPPQRRNPGRHERKPKEGDFRTNVHAGAHVFKHEVTDKEREICR